MKKIKIDLKGAPILILIEVIIAVVVCAALIGGVIFPGFNSWIVVSGENKVNKDKLANVERNIQEISAIDRDQLADLKTFLDGYLPDGQDAIPLFVLVEALAQTTQVEVSLGQYEPGTGTAVPAAGTGQVATSPIPPAAASGGFTLRATLEGSYSAIENFLKGLKTINRVVSITSMSLNSEDGKTVLALTLKAPLFGAPPSATAEVLVGLTSAEIAELQVLADGVSIKAAPSENPVGRESPF